MNETIHECRPLWVGQDGDRYIPVFGDWHMSYGMPPSRSWTGLSQPCETREKAQAAGFRGQGSDDFNIVVARNGTVVALLYMEHDMQVEPDVLREIQERFEGVLS